MKVVVAINNRRGNANIPTQTVEAASTIEGLRKVLQGIDEKTFKEHGYITASAYCHSTEDTKAKEGEA